MNKENHKLHAAHLPFSGAAQATTYVTQQMVRDHPEFNYANLLQPHLFLRNLFEAIF